MAVGIGGPATIVLQEPVNPGASFQRTKKRGAVSRAPSAQAVEALERGASYDSFVCAAGYLIGEYGVLLKEVPPLKQFKLLHDRFVSTSPDTKASRYPNSPVPREQVFRGALLESLTVKIEVQRKPHLGVSFLMYHFSEV